MNILYTSREQMEVHKFSIPVLIAAPLLAIFFQSFVTRQWSWTSMIDVPLLITIFFAVSRRNPVIGLLQGGAIGLIQDALTHHFIGVNGIAKTVVGFLASSLGAKIDVESPGTRVLMTLAFYIIHQVVFIAIMRGMLNEPMGFDWPRLAIAGLVNGVISVPLFAVLDRFKQRS